MSLHNTPSQGNGLKGVYTTEETPGSTADSGRGRGRGRGVLLGKTVSVQPGQPLSSTPEPAHDSGSLSGKMETVPSDRPLRLGRGRGRGIAITGASDIHPITVSPESSQASRATVKPKSTPENLATRIESLKEQSIQLNRQIHEHEHSFYEKDFSDDQVRSIHQQFIAIFQEIDSLLSDETLSPSQKDRILIGAKKNTDRLDQMMSRLAERNMGRDELVFNLTLPLMELSLQPRFNTATQQKMHAWLVASTNKLAYNSITELSTRLGVDALELLKNVSSVLSKYQISQPSKALYNLNYSLAVHQLREGLYNDARQSLTEACDHHHQKRLQEFLSVVAAIESQTGSKSPCPSLEDILGKRGNSYATSTGAKIDEGMTDEELVHIANDAVQFAQDRLLLIQQLIYTQFREKVPFNELNTNTYPFQRAAVSAIKEASKTLFPLCVHRHIGTMEVARLIADLKKSLTMMPVSSTITAIKETTDMNERNIALTITHKIKDIWAQYQAQEDSQQKQRLLQEVQQLRKVFEAAVITPDGMEQSKRVMLQIVLFEMAEKEEDYLKCLSWLKRWEWASDSKSENWRINQIRKCYKRLGDNDAAIEFEKKVQVGDSRSQLNDSFKRMAKAYYHMQEYDHAITATHHLEQSEPLFYHCQMALLLTKKNKLQDAWEHLQLASKHVNDFPQSEHKAGRHLYHKRMAFFHNFLVARKQPPTEFVNVSKKELMQKALYHAGIAKDNASKEKKELTDLIDHLTVK